MKIAQIAPLAESCPPRLYGGTERVISYLTEELVQRGQSVTLFASGDSTTSAELVSCCETGLRLDRAKHDPLPYHLIMLDEVRRRADQFDILHFHIELIHFPLIRALANRTLTTLHNRLDLPDLVPFYSAFSEIPLVSVSDAQRQPLPPVNWVGTVHHGLPPDLLPLITEPQGDYLAFLGRISPEKRPDRAIEIAAAVGMPLKIAAKIGREDEAYWETTIAPMIEADGNVEFLGEIGQAQKVTFLGNAVALLFPLEWPEPFGLVAIEAMACGTPVIAFPCGAVSEVVDDGVSGFIVEDVDQAVDALRRVETLDRARVRAAFEDRFTVARMAEDYLSIYRALAGCG